ncbi:hypothetical protein OAB00_03125 [Akkermansiaceae bacterium]|nr:hypothetical protein [Akkermansiaceae bacterium]
MMNITDYLTQLKPLSVHARFAIGLRLFERYVRLRGLEDESIWEFLEHMWEFPLLSSVEEKLIWGEKRGELADHGLGDELPEELEEEMYSLAINEDYVEIWISNVTELAWTNLLQGPQDEESLCFLKRICILTIISKMGVPDLQPYQTNLFSDNNGWGNTPTLQELASWQSNPCDILLEIDDLTKEILEDHISEILQY